MENKEMAVKDAKCKEDEHTLVHLNAGLGKNVGGAAVEGIVGSASMRGDFRKVKGIKRLAVRSRIRGRGGEF